MTQEECTGDCDRCDCKWSEPGAHEFDDDAFCIKCGFDGAEWYWWKHSTYEWRASDAKMPTCKALEGSR